MSLNINNEKLYENKLATWSSNKLFRPYTEQCENNNALHHTDLNDLYNHPPNKVIRLLLIDHPDAHKYFMAGLEKRNIFDNSIVLMDNEADGTLQD